MLIYVIPLILLIIVLIVVKKRQDAQGSDKPKANTAKARKTASSARTTPAKSRVVEEPAAKSQEAVALSADLRKKIERLINEGNFFAAEAQINQALKKDNRQHELYLLLLDIHIQQKDEFAISQLINHIRSLGLDNVLAQAEAKKAEFENSATSTKDTIDSPSAQLSSGSPVSEPTPVDNNAAFEELSPTHSPVINDLAFDELQQESQPQKAVFEPAPSQNDIQPLEFNFEPSFSKPASDEVKDQPVSKGLEFKFSDSPIVSEPVPTTTFDTATPPDFSFDLNTSTTAETEIAPIAEPENAAPVIDFSLDLGSSETPEVTPAPATESVQPLDFSFSVDTTPTSDTQAEVAAPEFDLSSITTTEPTISATPAVASELDFKLDAVPEKPASAGISFEIPSEPAISTVNQNDPLIQSFPELKETDEVVLNLELAEQYIQLGAYDAAREILSEKEADYSPQQRTHVDLLLNRIAS